MARKTIYCHADAWRGKLEYTSTNKARVFQLIPPLVKDNNLSVPLKEAREIFEKEYLTTQLKKFGGNISKTAKFVGMERSALHRKLKGLGVKDLN